MLSSGARGTLLAVRVVPGAKKDQIVGEENGRLKVRLQAPPVEGKANKALLKLLARRLSLKKAQLTLVAGEHARDKVIELGVELAEAHARLNKALEEE